MDIDFDKVADAMNDDGHAIAVAVMERSFDSPEIAMALLGVATGKVLDAIPDPERRAAVMQTYLESFQDG
jgi:hypothetical protein